MRVLVTGGAGFIGSHTIVELLAAGHEPVIVDNLSNSDLSVVDRLSELTGRTIEIHQADIRDTDRMIEIASEGFDACIHFAALKAVAESVADPLRYYDTNVGGTVSLLKALEPQPAMRFVFSSSATVYGPAEDLPLKEDLPLGEAVNPYGWTKIMMEQVLSDFQSSKPDWTVTLLRYFNPVGAHPSGLIGEEPRGVPSNLMPYVAKVAAGELPEVLVFGNDYPTPDGTGIRDYVHVVDLAVGHVAALQGDEPGVHVYNLGTGEGHSVFEVIDAYSEASGRAIPYRVVERRPGDVAASWADVSKAESEIGWKATRSLGQMCLDSWKWQQR